MRTLTISLAAVALMAAIACGEPPAKTGTNNGGTNNGGTNNGGTNNGGTNNGGTNNGGTNNVASVYEITDFAEGCDGIQDLNGEAILEGLPTEAFYEMEWTAGGTTPLMLLPFGHDGATLTCSRGWEPPLNSGAASSPAELTLSDVQLEVITEDGRLQDVLVGTATKTSFGDGVVIVRADIAVDSLTGDWRPEGDAPTLYAEALFQAPNGSGILATSTDPAGQVSSRTTIATWPAR